MPTSIFKSKTNLMEPSSSEFTSSVFERLLSSIYNKAGKRAEKQSAPAHSNYGLVSSKLKRTQYLRTRQDIGRWRNAITLAENPESPNRSALYQIYEDLVLDSHLASVVNTRKVLTLSEEFIIEKGNIPDKEKTALLSHFWFIDFLELCLDSIFYGHSLVEFSFDPYGEVLGVELIPRANVIPEKGEIKENYGDREGTFSYREAPYNEVLVEVGRTKDLGLFAKVAPNVLWKKSALTSWSEYAEVFGMPLRIGKTNSNDPTRIDQMEQMLQQMGSAAYGVFDFSEEVSFIETGKSDAYLVFDKLVERANSEISKLVLGQTMTVDNGSSESQAKVHQNVMANYMWADQRLIEFTVNNKLIPFLIAKGYELEDCRFKWKGLTLADKVTD